MVNLSDFDNTLILLHTELGDTLAGGDMGVASGVDGHLVNVAVTAVGFVDDADAVGLQDAVLLESRTSGRQNDLVAGLADLDGDAQINHGEITSFQVNVLHGAAVHPLAGVSLLNRPGVIVVVFDENVNSIHIFLLKGRFP